MPVLANKWNWPAGTPISKKHLGSHKTYRGFYSAYLGALFILYFQKNYYTLENFSYLEDNIFFLAILFGIGAMLGDSIKSFIKRKLNKKPGTFFFPWDQIDFIIGSYLLVSIFYKIEISILFTALLITPVLHLCTNIVAYKLNLKEVWY